MKNPSVIIIRKPPRDGHDGRRGGAWKVAYADFVTAMMAFFLVMWLVTQSQAVKQSVAGYFKDPGIFNYQRSNGVIPGGAMKLEAETADKVRLQNTQNAEQARQALEGAAGHLKEALSGLPEFKRLERQVEIQVTAEGLRIELVEGSTPTFFDSGSATLKPGTEHILATIAIELGKIDDPVVLEGHTDSQAFSKPETTYTNWELSADRANAARRVMERSGLRPGQVRGVRGYADTQPRVADSFDPRNRRVSIVVQNSALLQQRMAAARELVPPGADVSARPSGSTPAGAAAPAAPGNEH